MVSKEIELIERIVPDTIEAHWRQLLESEDHRDKWVRLKGIERTESLDALVNRTLARAGVTDEYFLVRQRSLDMLAQTGVKSDIYRCIQCLTDKSWEVRSSAADALGAIRSEAAKKALLARLQIDKHYIVRRDIASSLAFYDLSAVPVLRHRLTVERNPIARLALLFTLYVHGDSDQLEPYLAYLDDSDFIVRNNACNNICVDLVKDRDVDKIVERLKRRMAIEDSPGVADDIEGVVERFQKKTSS